MAAPWRRDLRPGRARRQLVRCSRQDRNRRRERRDRDVGVYELPKLASAVIAAGARVAWDDTAKQVVLPGAGKAPIGIAIEAAGNGAATVRVRLDGVATAAA